MDLLFVPFLLLVVLPLGLLARFLGLFRTPTLRVATTVFLSGLALFALPPDGLDAVVRERLELVIVAFTTVLLMLRHLRASGWQDDRRYRQTLGFTALAALLVFTNFFHFHPGFGFLHPHDFTHYYLGSKYFPELGYRHLYVGMLRAEAEAFDGQLAARKARDLDTNGIVDSRDLVARSEPVRATFTDERWEQFRNDVVFVREMLGSAYPRLLVDHGFNPSPVWARVGGALANRIPLEGGLRFLVLIDPLLQGMTLLVIFQVFGFEALCLTIVFFCVCFGAGFEWLGGTFLRQLWLVTTLGAACATRTGRPTLSGSLLAFAACLRIFPVAFAAVPFLRGLTRLWREKRFGRREASFAAGFLGTATVLIGWTVTTGGLGAWTEFFERIGTHAASWSGNRIGFRELVALTANVDFDAADATAQLEAARATSRVIQLVLIVPAALVFVAALCRFTDPVAALGLGSFLILAGLDLAAYYFTFLLLVLLGAAREPGRLAFLFGTQLLMHLLQLFEEDPRIIFLYYCAPLVLYGLIGVYGPEIRRLLGRCGTTSPPTAAA